LPKFFESLTENSVALAYELALSCRKCLLALDMKYADNQSVQYSQDFTGMPASASRRKVDPESRRSIAFSILS